MVVSYFKITGHQLILIGHRLCVAVRSVNHHVGDQSAIRGKKSPPMGSDSKKKFASYRATDFEYILIDQ